MLVVVQVDCVRVQAGQQEVISLADEPHLLALLQHLLKNIFLTVKNDEIGFGEENLFEYVSVAIIIVDQLFYNQPGN